MEKFRHEQIEALLKAIDLCREGGCESAIPSIVQQIRWIEDNF